jgi:hypothetical protein
MHVEPGIVNGVKIALSYATAAGAGAYTIKLAYETLKAAGAASFVSRTLLAMTSVFTFFQVLPHYPVGVSEVHFILGSTLFLIFGAAPAAFGLALGLFVQGVLFAPADLPQYFINLTTLLVPLFAVATMAKRAIAPNTAYIDLTYAQALKLSTTYQAGVVSWVAFWAFYGQGFGAENVAAVTSFGAAYMLVILIEPIADLAVLAGAKSLASLEKTGFVQGRVYRT